MSVIEPVSEYGIDNSYESSSENSEGVVRREDVSVYSSVRLSGISSDFKHSSKVDYEHHSSFQNNSSTSLYLEGADGSKGRTVIINPDEDDYNIIYVNPVPGVLNIVLGKPNGNIFPNGKEITFKDVTLEYAPTSSYNVNISVPNISSENGTQTRIEHHNGGYTSKTNSSYSLNTSGGSVTFVFTDILPNVLPTWVIKSQFTGNHRVIGTSGFKFKSCSDNIKTKIINK